MPESQRTRDLREVKLFVLEIARGNTVEDQFYITLLPETYTLDQPGRVNVQQTRGSWWVDNFGLGVGTLAFAGTTGFTTRPNPETNRSTRFGGDVVDRYERWQQLRAFFQKFFENQAKNPNAQYYMRFLNWTDEDYFLVVPVGLPRLQRNIAQSLLYRYEVNFHVLTRLNDLGYKNDPDILDEINSKVKRAAVIADRIDEKLVEQWKAFVQFYLNRTTITDDTTEEELLAEGLTPTVRDAQLQAFYDTILARNAPAGYVPATDSQSGVVTRTRTLAEKITQYVNGETAFVETTLAEARAVTAIWRDVFDALDYATHVPRIIAREVRETFCGVQALLLYPQIFRSSVVGTVESINALFKDSGCATTIQV